MQCLNPLKIAHAVSKEGEGDNKPGEGNDEPVGDYETHYIFSSCQTD